MNIQSFFINNRLLYLIKCICIIIIYSKCTYQFPINTNQNKKHINPDIQITVILDSYDSFNTLARIIKQELYLNNIRVINNRHSNLEYTCTNENTFLLKILNSSEKRIVVSVFQDGTASEYQIILEINTQYCKLTNKTDCHPINIHIRQTLINNPNGSLSNLIQENEILETMYVNAAQQLIQQFLIQLQYLCTDF